MKNHRYQEPNQGIIHAAKLLHIHDRIDLAVTLCGRDIPADKSYHTYQDTINCIYCREGWTRWQGGTPPVKNDEQVEIWWPNGIKRVYPGEHIAWKNLDNKRVIFWRKITPPPAPLLPNAVWLYKRPEDGSLFARDSTNDPEPRGGVLYVRQT